MALVVAFGLFCVGVVLSMANPERFRAEAAAAERLGVAVRDLPGPVVSEIARGHSSAGYEVLSGLPSVAALVLFAIAAYRLARGGRLPGLVLGAGLVAAGTWAGCMALYVALYAEPGRFPWVTEHFVGATKVAVAVTVMSGCVAVLALALVLRARSIATRTSVVVGLFALLGFVLAPVPSANGMPPILPVALAMVLGIVLIRSVDRAERPS